MQLYLVGEVRAVPLRRMRKVVPLMVAAGMVWWGMDAETAAARGGSVRACDADDNSIFADAGAPAVVGQLLLDPGRPSRVEGTRKLKGEELAARGERTAR